MYGLQLFGVPLYGQSSYIATFLPSEEFTYNTYGLQNATQYGIKITDYTIETPSRDFVTSPTPGNHGLILQEDWYRANLIVLRGWVSAPTKIQLDNKIHEVMKNLRGKDGQLIISNGGNFKTIQTTLQKATFENEHWSTTKKKFEFEFSGTTSFWQDLEYTAGSILQNATMSVDGTMLNTGSVEADPVIIVLFETASGVTGATFENTTTGEYITITETIDAGDSLIFNCEEKKVLLNGIEVEYSGRFPVLQNGLNTFTIEIDGTSALVDVTAKHKNQYITP